MCLIITGQSAKIRDTLLNTQHMLDDIFEANADGLGVMYANKRGLKVIKVLPKNLEAARGFIDRLPKDDRQMAMHWRMKTHGDIDLTNCHPYEVGTKGELAYMHNGILHTGNAADKTKSDTWHFARDFLDDAADDSLDVFQRESFLSLIGEFIGDNRFVFMDAQGRMSIVNKEQGVEHDGMWFSNTYAWMPERLIPGYKSKYSVRYYKAGRWDDEDDDLSWGSYAARRQGVHAQHGQGINHTWTDDLGKQFCTDVLDADVDKVKRTLSLFPFSALQFLLDHFEPRRFAKDFTHTKVTEEILAAVEAASKLPRVDRYKSGMQTMATQMPHSMADAICYDLDWSMRADLPALGWETSVPAEDPEVPPHLESDAAAADDDDGMSDDGQEYLYRRHRIRVFFDSHANVWGYSTFGAEDNEVDSGFGYDDSAQARDWAMGQLNDLLKKQEIVNEAVASLM